MITLVVPREAIRFPSRCVECGAQATDHFSLTIPDHPPSRPTTIAAPLCTRCSERKSFGQVLWVGAAAIVGVALTIAAAACADALIPVIPAIRSLVAPIVILCLAIGVIPIALALRGGRRFYHRRFSAVWMEDRGPTPAEAILGFRDADLLRDVATLSGLPVLGAAPFREAARQPEEYRKADHTYIPAWAIAATGIGVGLVGVGRYWDLGRPASSSLSTRLYWVEVIPYAIAGRAGVLAMFAAIGVALTCLGVARWRQIMRSGS